MELNDEEDDAVFNWFYDHKPSVEGKKLDCKKWKLSLAVMANLYRLAGNLIPFSSNLVRIIL